MSQTQTTETEREPAAPTEWVVVARARGTKTRLHKPAAHIDTDELEINDEIETACQKLINDEDVRWAKPATCYPKGYKELCPNCYPEESNHE